MSFRFETHSNVVTKHHLGSKLHWSQAARWAFLNHNEHKDWTVVHVKQIDADTVELVRRRDQNLGLFFRYFGTTQKGFYERVTVNRKTQQTAIDRIDGNWNNDEPFLGRRDLFYVEDRENHSNANGQLTFVRHDFWLPSANKFGEMMKSHFAAWSFKRSFGSTPASQ